MRRGRVSYMRAGRFSAIAYLRHTLAKLSWRVLMGGNAKGPSLTPYEPMWRVEYQQPRHDALFRQLSPFEKPQGIEEAAKPPVRKFRKRDAE